MEQEPKTFIRRAIKFVAWVFAGILSVIILTIVALQFPGVQRYIAQKAVSSLAEKTRTRIEIGSISIAFTHSVVVHELFVESRQRDTLLYVQTLAVDVNLLDLFWNEVSIKNVQVDSLTAHVTRTLPDSAFNFDFILDALSSDSISEPDTSAQTGWRITLGSVSLKGVNASYDDEVSGMNALFRVGTLKVTMDRFDLDKMQFYVDELSIQNTTATIIQTKDSPPDESKPLDVDLGFHDIALAKVHFIYQNKVTNELYDVDLGTANLVAQEFDLVSHTISLEKFLLEDTKLVAVQSPKAESQTQEPEVDDIPWTFSLDQLLLNNTTIRYDVPGTARIKGLDPNHLRLDSIAMSGEHLQFSDNRIAANLSHTAFREQSGFEVRELSGEFVVDSLRAQFKDFVFETATSRIHQNSLLRYSSISALKNISGDVKVEATISDSHVAISDLLLLQPDLPIKNKPGAVVRFASQLSGRVDDLRLDKLRVAVGDSTTLDLDGSIRGLPDAKTAHFDVHLRQFASGSRDIRALVADTLLPKEFVVPASIRMNGNFAGSMKNFSASTAITTSAGSLNGNVALQSTNDSTKSRWKADVVVDELNIGSLLNDTETFGPVTLKATATGTGLSREEIEAQLNVDIEKVVLNGYPYRNLAASGTANPKMFEGKAEIRDSNVAFTFNGTVNTSEVQPQYKFTFDLKGADLQRLRLTSDDMRVAGVVTSDLTGRDINDINGTIDIRNVVIMKNRKRYLLDSLQFVAVNNERETHIGLESKIIGASFDGTIAMGELPATLKKHFSRYFNLHDSTVTGNARAQAFTFRVALREPRMVTELFFPQVDRLNAGFIEGSYDSEKMNLNLNIEIPTITVSGYDIDSLNLKVTSDTRRLQSVLRVGSIADSMLHLTNLQLNAGVQDDSIDIALQSTDAQEKTMLLLAGVCSSVPNGYKFRFHPDGIVFQNSQWSVPADNSIVFGPKMLLAHDVVLRGAGQSISLRSEEGKTQQPPLKIEFADFDLGTISHVVERDSGLVDGSVNGNIVLQNFDKQMAFTSDLAIKNFSFGQRLIGDIKLVANNQTENVFDVKIDIAGNENDIDVKGQYKSKEGGSELNFNLDLHKVNLASVEPFTFGAVKRLSGTMSGALHLVGTMKKPSITGNLKFTAMGFNPTMLDSYLKVDNGEIGFDGKGVHFGAFDLIDTLGNKATLSGNLMTDDFRDFSYDFRVHTNHFLLMNKPASRDALYYGIVFLDSDISVRGDQDKPIIRMQARFDKGTDLAVVLPERDADVQERRGIVRFVDVRNPANTIMSRRKSGTDETRDTTRTRLSRIDLTSNIEVNKESRLRILIDPIAGDSLVIRGEATFSVGVDASGRLAVTGRYEIQEGSYQLSFGKFIRREFAIPKGSSLTWFGSVTDANVDITAVYTAKTSALDLVQDQLVGLSQEERNKYKQELRIQVYLMMDGKLLEPNIRFRLDLPPDQRSALGGTVYAKLNELNGQESELNKQVFALLVLGRFISTNPFASATDGGQLTGLARSSVSQILTEQLNRLSEKFIKSVTLNVGVESYQDYSTGSAEGRTQLQLALTKQLFDERVSVQVGGNVDIEGSRSQQNSLNNFAGDIKVAYKMTEDGRWQLQVFRQNTNGGAIEGDLVETGVGIVFTIDYDKLFGLTLKPVQEKAEEK